ncbi:hypothetical protein NBRC116602_26790 [Hyphomicrobiales bacterium 4NK60-0047b]
MLREIGITKIYDVLDLEMAMNELEEKQFDFIIYDNYRAVTSDVEVITFLRNNETFNQTTPIIVLSEEGSRSKVIKAASLGCDAFLIKPFSIIDLKTRFDQILQGNRQSYNAWLKAKFEQTEEVDEADIVEL